MMRLDAIDAQGLNIEKVPLTTHFQNLNKGFDTKSTIIDGCYQKLDSILNKNITRMISTDNINIEKGYYPNLMESTKRMLHGSEVDGLKTLGLEQLSKWKINPDYETQNIKQQSGFAAEIISTYKENNDFRRNGSDVRTYRTDDLSPDLLEKYNLKKNDQYVDKIRLNAEGAVVERIQTKFIGKDGKQWVSKMMGKDFDKYFDGKVDKIECPSDFYDDAKASISQQLSDRKKQLDAVSTKDKIDVVQKLQRNIDKLQQLDNMIEKSTVSTDEAIFARRNPKEYSTQVFKTEVAKVTKASHSEGLKSGALSAGITFAVSTVDNISSYANGEITATEMVTDIVTETATSGLLGYGTEFISTAVSQTMRTSSHQLIKTVGQSSLPAAAVSFAVESYDAISDFAQGKIDGCELAYELGEDAVSVAGGFIAGAKVGALLGTPALGPVGTFAGTMVGGMIGCVIATEAYETAIDLGTEGVEFLAEKANDFAKNTIETVAEHMPEELETVKTAFTDFINSTNLPFKL